MNKSSENVNTVYDTCDSVTLFESASKNSTEDDQNSHNSHENSVEEIRNLRAKHPFNPLIGYLNNQSDSNDCFIESITNLKLPSYRILKYK